MAHSLRLLGFEHLFRLLQFLELPFFAVEFVLQFGDSLFLLADLVKDNLDWALAHPINVVTIRLRKTKQFAIFRSNSQWQTPYAPCRRTQPADLWAGGT